MPVELMSAAKIGEAHNPETHLIPLILQVPNGQRESISIFGDDYDTKDGTCVRDYIHVTDLAQAHILAVKYLMDGGKSDVFNLGNGVGFTVKEVIETARKSDGTSYSGSYFTTPWRRSGKTYRIERKSKEHTWLET